MNVKELRTKHKLSQDQLSTLTGIPKGRIAMWEYRNSQPKHQDFEVLSNFFDKYDNKMLSINKKLKTNDNKSYEVESIGVINEDKTPYISSGNQFIDIGKNKMQMLVPLINTYAYAGYLSGYADQEYIEELPKFPIIVERNHQGTYRAFKVKGDSMDNDTRKAICAGDIVVARKIEKHHWKSKLHIKQWKNFVIVHEDGIVIKEIIEHDVEAGTITCMSLNPDKEFYPNFKLHLSTVFELYNIIQVSRTQ